jgi:hypothetical protein
MVQWRHAQYKHHVALTSSMIATLCDSIISSIIDDITPRMADTDGRSRGSRTVVLLMG